MYSVQSSYVSLYVHFMRVTTTYDFDDLMLKFVRMNPRARVCGVFIESFSSRSVQYILILHIVLYVLYMYKKTYIPAGYICIYK